MQTLVQQFATPRVRTWDEREEVYVLDPPVVLDASTGRAELLIELRQLQFSRL